MTKTGKRLLLLAIGSVLALSIVVFGLLLWRANRHKDRNNEDVVLKFAKAAVEKDDPPGAAHFYYHLTRLNQFREDYRVGYCQALLRVRDFVTLAAFTNANEIAFEVPERDKKFEELYARGNEYVSGGSNELAHAVFTDATNLNYYVAAPLLVECKLRLGYYADALDIIRAYVKRFPLPRLFVTGVELCAIANRPDLIAGFSSAYPESGRFKIVFGNYCDALVAWNKGDLAAAGAALRRIRNDVKTPLSSLIWLESVCRGDSAEDVHIAWIQLMEMPELLDFRIRGRNAVKGFLAAHFPDKLPAADFGKICDELLKFDGSDIDILRTSLVVKLMLRTLQPHQIEEAEKLFPDDRGIKRIREQYLREGK